MVRWPRGLLGTSWEPLEGLGSYHRLPPMVPPTNRRFLLVFQLKTMVLEPPEVSGGGIRAWGVALLSREVLLDL